MLSSSRSSPHGRRVRTGRACGEGAAPAGGEDRIFLLPGRWSAAPAVRARPPALRLEARRAVRRGDPPALRPARLHRRKDGWRRPPSGFGLQRPKSPPGSPEGRKASFSRGERGVAVPERAIAVRESPASTRNVVRGAPGDRSAAETTACTVAWRPAPSTCVSGLRLAYAVLAPARCLNRPFA